MNHREGDYPIRILLVEDSPHDQIAFQRALDKSTIPFEVTVCERSEEISAAMQAGSDIFDMVVVDQDLPGLTGLDAFKVLQQKSELPPFVMLTGTGSENLAVDALKAGMYDYIIKDAHQGYLQLLPLKLEEVRKRYDDRMARLSAKEELQRAHANLEKRVEQRTAELARSIEALEQEVAERIKTEQALRASEKALRALSLKIVETQENERKIVAKELHDSIGANLAAIKFAVEEKLQSMRRSPPKDIISLEKIVGHIHDTIKEVRRISTSLRPSMLDDLGLLATIRWFCSSSAEIYVKTRIESRLDIEEDDIPDLSKIVIYRVLQEALNNALRHSAARTVRVHLQNVNDCIRLHVTDNGCGFDFDHNLKSADPLTGYGLRGMFDRAEVIGGSLTVDSRPGQGTAVHLELPCEVNLKRP